MRENRDIWALLAVLALLALFALSCAPKPVEVVKSFQEAYNSYDLEKVLSLFAEDASFEVVEVFSLRGKEQIRDLVEHDFFLKVHMAYNRFSTRGDSVMCQLRETNDWLKTAGIEEAHYSVTFVVSDGLIEYLRAKQAPETERAFKRVLGPLMNWASQQRPQMVEEMMPQGKFIYNAKNARKSLSLLREWKQFQQRKALRPGWKKLGE